LWGKSPWLPLRVRFGEQQRALQMKPGIVQRQVWRISGAYFNPCRSVLPLMCLAAIVFMTLFSVRTRAA
jgi:ABC-type uncharacterized transport system fused permease/ATPase subunit